MKPRTLTLVVTFCLLLSVLVTGCQPVAPGQPGQAGPAAQPAKVDYPTGPIKIIVPRGAGGSNDIIARLVASYLEKYIGKPVVVENVPDGGGVVGVQQVQKAKPDGYTLLFSTPTTDILKQVVEGTTYDYKKMVPVYNIGGGDSNIIVVSTSSGINTFKDFVDKAKSGGVSIGRLSGVNVTNYGLAFLADVAGVPIDKITNVPYDDGKQPSLQVAGGKLDAALNQRSDVVSLVKDGKLKPIVIFTKARSPNFPDLPTFMESYPGADNYYEINQGLMAPEGTPAEIVKILNDALDKVTKDTEYVTKAKELFSPSPMGSATMATELNKMFVQSEKMKPTFAKFSNKQK